MEDEIKSQNENTLLINHETSVNKIGFQFFSKKNIIYGMRVLFAEFIGSLLLIFIGLFYIF